MCVVVISLSISDLCYRSDLGKPNCVRTVGAANYVLIFFRIKSGPATFVRVVGAAYCVWIFVVDRNWASRICLAY